MSSSVAQRILLAVDALPLRPGIRVLEVGCGPGVAAREIVRRWPSACVLGIDRSPKAIQQALAGSQAEIARGSLAFRQVAAEAFELEADEQPYDLAFALRVGALDGRHPAAGAIAIPRIKAALRKGGRIFIDGGSPLREVGEA
ncbi:MAG TPA: class I SAM-dependent methyltransferase [Rubrivivax sp.]|jgi:SAM-dependent methyltransferase|nr:class I SAM-dependent methyltransferase [Rubrivivax sp.]